MGAKPRRRRRACDGNLWIYEATVRYGVDCVQLPQVSLGPGDSVLKRPENARTRLAGYAHSKSLAKQGQRYRDISHCLPAVAGSAGLAKAFGVGSTRRLRIAFITSMSLY